MNIVELWRHLVKSLLGERMPTLRLVGDGVEGDRMWGIIEYTMPKGRFVDEYPVMVMTTAGLRGGAVAYPAGTWDVRRFRPNILIQLDGEGWLEDAWAGRRLTVGSTQLIPRQRCIRCTMVNRAQPSLDKDVNIYKTLYRSHRGEAGMWSQVLQPGSSSEGDAVEIA